MQSAAVAASRLHVLKARPSRVYFLDIRRDPCFKSAALQRVFFGHPFGACFAWLKSIILGLVEIILDVQKVVAILPKIFYIKFFKMGLWSLF